eukprot:25205-Eustigmatos_ZCMA.PRE.1
MRLLHVKARAESVSKSGCATRLWTQRKCYHPPLRLYLPKCAIQSSHTDINRPRHILLLLFSACPPNLPSLRKRIS